MDFRAIPSPAAGRSFATVAAVALALVVGISGCGSTTGTTTYLHCATGPIVAALLGKTGAVKEVSINPRQHPGSCSLLGYSPPTSLELVRLKRLRWSDWGSESARAVGVILYPEPARHVRLEPVEVTASKVKTCGDRHFYSRMTVDWKSRRRTWNLNLRPCATKDS